MSEPVTSGCISIQASRPLALLLPSFRRRSLLRSASHLPTSLGPSNWRVREVADLDTLHFLMFFPRYILV